MKNTSSKESLQKKREMLRIKTKIKERLGLIETFTAQLDEKECDYEIHIDEVTGDDIEDICNWPFTIFPETGWGSINWNKVENKSQISTTDLDEIRTYLMSDFDIDEGETVFVQWSNAIRPTISLKYRDCLREIETLLGLDMDCWIFSIEKSMIFEFYHEGVASIGRS